MNWTQNDAERILHVVCDRKWNKYSEQSWKKISQGRSGWDSKTLLCSALFLEVWCHVALAHLLMSAESVFIGMNILPVFYVCAPYLCLLTTEVRRARGTEFPKGWFVNCFECAGNPTQVLRRRGKCFSELSHHSSLGLQFSVFGFLMKLKSLHFREARWPIQGP